MSREVRGQANYRRSRELAFLLRQLLVASIPLVCLVDRGSVENWPGVFLLLLAAGTLNLAYFLLARRSAFTPTVQWLQVTVDMVLWTALIHLTGDVRSLFYFGYPFEILVSAMTLRAAAAIYGGVLALLLYPTVILASGHAGDLVLLFPRLLVIAATLVLSVLLLRKFETKNRVISGLRDELQRRLDRTDAELRVLVERMNGGLLTLDAAGRLTGMNPAAERLAGYAAAEMMGRPIEETFCMKDGLGRMLRDALRSGTPVAGAESFLVARDGARVPVSVNTFFLPPGHTSRVAAIFYDERERQSLRVEAERSARLRDLGEMAAGVAHEIRNPLTSIRGFSSLLREEAAAGARARTLASKIDEGVETLCEILDDLLTYTRVQAPETRRVDLRDVVRSALHYAPEPTAGVRLSVELPDAPLPADVDPGQIRQAVLNLVKNALEAVADGGEVVVRARSAGDQARIEVEDDGPGIPPEVRSRIGIPFVSTKRDGTGLGISISRKFVEGHRGTLANAPRAPRGTVFTIRLPRYGVVPAADGLPAALIPVDAGALPEPLPTLVGRREEALLG